MSQLEKLHVPLLKELYHKRRWYLDRLPGALRSLVQISEDYEARTGNHVEPWELWKLMMLHHAQSRGRSMTGAGNPSRGAAGEPPSRLYQ